MTTLYDLLERHLGAGADRPLLVTPDGTYSSADVARESARVAAWLRDAGLAPGDRVVVDLKNGADAVAALFGASRAGAVVVGATPQWTLPQLAHVLADSGARFLVTNDLRARQLGAKGPPNVLVRGATADGATSWETLTTAWDGREPTSPSDPAILIYTSGSTGAPKGVVHPHANLIDFARIVSGYLENTADDRLMWLLGWSFGYGLSQLLTMCFTGGCLVVPESMLAADVVKAHEEHGTTAIAQVPHGWDQLVGFLEKTDRRLTGLRYVTNAGDGPSLALLERLPRALPGAKIVLMYGQTECLRTTYLPADRFEDKLGAMGFPIPGVDVFVVDEHGEPCGVDQPGELLHRGALLSAGYWNAPEATAAKLRPEPCLRDRIGDEPVLHTGDIVRRDADGCLWYVGRSERMIKSSGFRFGPSEIEAILLAAPLVREALVFGVDDPTLGQAVEAAVVMADGSADASALLLAVKKQLPRYMVPRRVHFVAEIPRNANGKVRLDALRALAR
ncbi:MAG: AMP-binding protein [Labilithrix sp.]|nr:AMP-binding protein [Labilithrix sp.]